MLDEFCHYIPAAPDWTLLTLDEDGQIVTRRAAITEWLRCGAFYRRLDVHLIQTLPVVADATVHSGGNYLVESPRGERLPLEAIEKIFKLV